MLTKPLLAANIADLNLLKWPLIASPKIDGTRALKIDGNVVTRTFKPIPNKFIRSTLSKHLPDGIDGEIIVGSTFQECSSAIMSHEGEPKFTFYAFDIVICGLLQRSYDKRIIDLKTWHNTTTENFLKILPTQLINNLDEFLIYEKNIILQGHEGVMLRSPSGPYKCGRSTFEEHYLLKYKKFETSEAIVIGFTEMMHNNNESKKSNIGTNKRSLKKSGMFPSDTLGTFIVKDIKTGIQFEIGTGEGLTQSFRKDIWISREQYLGKIIHYKHQPHGTKEKPRLPVFLGFRNVIDI
jgi:DNA ligase 1